MQLPKTPGSPLILQKNHLQKRFFAYISRTARDIEKTSQTKVVDRKILHKNDLSLFLIKLSLRKTCKSCNQLAAGGDGRRGLRPCGCSEALGRIRCWLAMLSYKRAHGLCVSAAHEPFFIS